MGVRRGWQEEHFPLDFENILLNVLTILVLTINGYETIKMKLDNYIYWHF